MIVHYFTVARRHLWQNWHVNLISLLGLAVGLASGLIIFLVVNYMFSFDRYHPHLDRTYWIVTDIKRETTMQTDAAPRPLADVLRRDYAFVESAVRLETFFGRTLSVPNGKGGWIKKFAEARNVCFTEPQYVDLFGVEWVSGNPKTALAAPNTIVLSERYAHKYFDTASALGKTLRLDNRTDLTVTGIVKDPPTNTQLRYDAFVSYATIPVLDGPTALADWQGLQAMCFVRLREGTDPDLLSQSLSAIRRRNLSPQEATQFDYQVLPLAELNHQRSGTAPRPVLYVLIGVGILLVMAGCINFINLATARALKRAREVGVRKVMGSTRWQLVGQFMLETALLVILSTFVALVLTQLSLPVVNQTLAATIEMLRPDLSIGDVVQPQAVGWFLCLIISVIILSGLYPALVLARFNPAKALTSQPATRTVGRLTVRQGLILGQFVLMQLFILSVLVITTQLQHMQRAEWGFRHESTQVVFLPQQQSIPFAHLREQWLQVPGVEQVAFGSDMPASPYNHPSPFSYHTATQPEPFETRVRAVDEHYLSVFDLSLVAGRNIRSTDTTGRDVLVNETLVKQLGISSPAAVVGKPIRVKDGDRVIVGVVRDFRSGDLHQPILPMTLIHDLPHSRVAMLRLNPTYADQTGQAIQQVWDKVLPDQVYHAENLSDLMSRFTELERLLAGMVQAFALVAIGLSCLGLYGLVTFMTEAKAKEIGVRRVLGARTTQLLWLLGREFGKLLGLGFFVAAPLGAWVLSGWLQQYTYRISVNGWLLIGTLVLTGLITALTVSRQALKAARTNPVHYLKSE
ncbi:ABC transporter permease [Spirosoma endophyticum]|uniref:ABC-type antimicrobial peptide transport system, permease component n=1 Tax=Spirosoma endophyticum TaxID=662367 RepID=A0A1I1LI17_9BACT|nr:ABC transporter permease [Spirosoma endophyticum]SFC72847.1 ABC-type antimicrobial peptide transport system, permease component [Spirosoma endophyticum]